MLALLPSGGLISLDPVRLPGLQFAFTVSLHTVFPSMSIGPGTFLALIEFWHLKTRDELYLRIYKFWSVIFVLGFGMGVVSGLVMSFQFGTNFSRFAEHKGSDVVLGAARLLAETRGLSGRLPSIDWYSFRPTVTAWGKEAGLKLEDMKTLLRHEDIATTSNA